jgi:hypothetical protein
VASLTRVFEWAKAHKAFLGKVLLFLAGGFEGVGMRELSVPIGAAGLWLHGAGRASSDREIKANQ